MDNSSLMAATEPTASEATSIPNDGDAQRADRVADLSGTGDTQPQVRRGHVRRIVEGTFNYGLGHSIPQLIKLLLLPIFTRILSPTDYGCVQLANRLGSFVITLMRQGMPGAAARYYYDHPEGPTLRDYVTTVAWYLLASSLLVGLVTLAVCPWVLEYLIPGLPMPLAFLTVMGGIAMVNGELQGRLVQAREQSGYQARLNVGRASISLALVVLFVVWPLRTGAAGMVASEVVSFGILALVAIWYMRAELRGRFQKSMLKSSLVYSWAMMPGDFVGSLTPLATSAILAGVQSTAANGIYFLALRVTQPLTMLGLAFQQAYNPIYFSVRKEESAAGMRRLAETARNVWAAAVGCAIGAALLGPPLIVLVTPADYHAAAPLVPIFALGFLGLTAYNLLGPEVFYSKKTWLVPLIAYGSAGMEIAIAALTVRSYGAVGVASGAAARMIVSAVIAGIISCRLVTIPYAWFSMIRIGACGAMAFVPIYLFASERVLWQLLAGVGGVLAYTGLLWLTGDPSIRDISSFLKRRFFSREQ